MLKSVDIEKLLFIDIETAPEVYNYNDLSSVLQQLWQKKVKHFIAKQSAEEVYKNRAGIYAEFAQIICISFGFLVFNQATEAYEMRIKSIANRDEKVLLQEFSEMIIKSFSSIHRFSFCGHNIKEFDIPFICRRLIINQLVIPDVLDFSGLKPWEINHIDTLDLWKFGDRKNFSSLSLIAHKLNIPTPKDDIDGSDVARVFYEDDDLDRIIKYCSKDVITVARLLMRLKGIDLIKDENVIYVE